MSAITTAAVVTRNYGVADLFSKKLIGHLGELQPVNYLRNYGYRIFFPGGSRGPADFIAIRGSSILAVQCKSSQSNLCDDETSKLLEFAAPIGATPVFTSRVNGRVKWHALVNGRWAQIANPKWTNLQTGGQA